MGFGDDFSKLESAAAALATDFATLLEAIVSGHVADTLAAGTACLTAARLVVTELEALGEDAQALFASYASGEPKMAASLGKVNWSNLVNIVVTYGPQVYAILAGMFGWPPLPPLPFPVPKPAPVA